MISRHTLRGLYAITPDETDTACLMQRVESALRGGVRVLQYRNKHADIALRLHQATRLRALTESYGIVFIVNDEADLAQAVAADGVHLGNGDGSVAAARARLGDDKLIGASCYNRLDLAQKALRQGADYVAFGAFFSSAVKPGAVRADVTLLQTARRELDAAIVAIGGITAQNGATLVDAGADALAVISALWNAPDIEQAARDFNKIFDKA